MKIENLVCLVSGGSQGLGADVVLKLVKEHNCRVI